MGSHARLAATLLLSLFLAAPIPAFGEEPAPPAPPPQDAGAEARADLEALQKEMEDTFVQIRKDFLALTGPGAADVCAALEAASAEEAKARAGAAPEGQELADAWVKRKLLGPVTAARLAGRIPEVSAKGTVPLAKSAAAAVKLVFPEAAFEDNWDKHFTDLDVVKRWAKARAAGAATAPATAPGPGKGPEPPRPAQAAEPDPSDMVLVQKGELQVPDQRGRGWQNAAQKAEKKTLKAFYIDRTEVSGAAYALFLKGLKDPKVRERVLPSGWKFDEKGVPVLPDGAAALPVCGIPYEGAATFAASLGKRLPSEDEWERAARGDGGLRYPWGNEYVEGNAVAAGKPGPSPVGSTTGDTSPFGALDMAGNVSEFCATYPDGKTVKGLPKATEQVVRRGGNYRESADEAANDWRYVIGPSARSDLVGFRCAMDEKDFERRYGKK
jgi:formylglycine-generating enzyme required for sulfatase activity